ncbi:MAG: alpha/beta hydrolase [Sphingomicrobium sp.]
MTGLLLAAALAAIATPLPAATGSTHAARPAYAPTRFSVTVEGRGPDVIFIPGLSSTREVWAASAARLKAHYRVHLVQLRGFGEPAGANASGPVLQPFVDDLAAYIRANRLHKPAIIGHSMGGLAALMIGVQQPALPGRLMIVDSFPFIGPVFGAPDLAAITPRATQLKAMILAQAASTKPDFAPADCLASLPVPATPAGNMSNSGQGACIMRHGTAASDLRVVGQAMYDDMTTDVRPDLGNIIAPLTMLYPQDDRLLTAAAADRLYADAYAGAKGAKLVRIPGSYHFIMQDQPAAFAAALDAFLKR